MIPLVTIRVAVALLTAEATAPMTGLREKTPGHGGRECKRLPLCGSDGLHRRQPSEGLLRELQ